MLYAALLAERPYGTPPEEVPQHMTTLTGAITQETARFIVETTYDDLPDALRAESLRCIVDGNRGDAGRRARGMHRGSSTDMWDRWAWPARLVSPASQCPIRRSLRRWPRA